VFYFVRAMLGLLCSASMTYLYSAVLVAYNNRVAKYMLFFMTLSTGIFISSTSFLPSTFAMYCLTVALAAWLKQNVGLAEVAVAAAAILGWPFAALVGVPIAVDIVLKKGIPYAIKYGVLSLVLFLAPSLALDTHYYGKLTLAVWNIVDYNVISKNLHGGSELYGVEPWYFYIMNGFLNFNVVLLLALGAGAMIVLTFLTGSSKITLRAGDMGLAFAHISGFYIWFSYMSSIPHKEERFIFPVYPQLCFAAALCLHLVRDLLSPTDESTKPWRHSVRKLIFLVLFASFAILSVSRTSAMLVNYGAPLKVYSEFENIPALGNKIPETICVGKEWYRFATHYFLPERFRLSFIKSDFGGQLPQYFPIGPNATRIIQPNFNDHNKEEPSRYVRTPRPRLNPALFLTVAILLQINVEFCDYVVDMEPAESFESVWPAKEWKPLVDLPFLEASKSHRFFRAFYVPYISQSKNSFSRYVLLKHIAKSH
jgi:alpha-1,2-mannosyltransferase